MDPSLGPGILAGIRRVFIADALTWLSLLLLACAAHLVNFGQTAVPDQPPGFLRVVTLNLHTSTCVNPTAPCPWPIGTAPQAVNGRHV